MRVVAAGAGDDVLAGYRVLHDPDQLDLLRVRKGRRFAGGAGDHHAVAAIFDKHLRQLGGRAVGDGTVLLEWRDHRGQKSTYVLAHAFAAPSAPSSIA